MQTVSAPTSQPRPAVDRQADPGPSAAQSGSAQAIVRDAGALFLKLFGDRMGGAFEQQRSADTQEKPNDAGHDRGELAERPAQTPLAPPVEAHAVATASMSSAAGHARAHELAAERAESGSRAIGRDSAPRAWGQAPSDSVAQPNGKPSESGAQAAPKGAEPAPNAAQQGAQQSAQQAPQKAEAQQAAAVQAQAKAPNQAASPAGQASAKAVSVAAAGGAKAAAQPGAVAGPGKSDRGVFQLRAQAKSPAPSQNARPAKETFEAQLARGLAAALKQKGGSVTMKLSPNELGSMKIEMKLDPSGLEARFEAKSPEARALLEQNLTSLRSALEAKGLAVERLRVEAPAQDERSSAEFGRGDERERPEGSGRERQDGPWNGSGRGEQRWGGAPGGPTGHATDGVGDGADGGVIGGSEGAGDERGGDPLRIIQGEGVGDRPRLSVDTVV